MKNKNFLWPQPLLLPRVLLFLQVWLEKVLPLEISTARKQCGQVSKRRFDTAEGGLETLAASSGFLARL